MTAMKAKLQERRMESGAFVLWRGGRCPHYEAAEALTGVSGGRGAEPHEGILAVRDAAERGLPEGFTLLFDPSRGEDGRLVVLAPDGSSREADAALELAEAVSAWYVREEAWGATERRGRFGLECPWLARLLRAGELIEEWAPA